MHLSVILPAYNEEARLEAGVLAVLEYLEQQAFESEVVIVNDGSTDGTLALAEGLARDAPRLRVVSFDKNRGKGAAVRRGVEEARGAYVLFTDVDQSTPIGEWSVLESRLESGYQVVVASREVTGSERVVPQPFYRRLMGYVFMVLRDLLVLPGFIDTQCGFKAFERQAGREIFRRARLDGFCFDVEALAIAVHLGYRVIEVPVKWTDDPRSRVSPVADSLHMFADLFRIRGNRRKGLYD